jgi:transposase
MVVQPGYFVATMILDLLTGRSPFYHIEHFMSDKDTELLLGQAIPTKSFNDDNLGRAMDVIFKEGTQKLFSAIAQTAIEEFSLDTSVGHMDTTSHSVWGEYLNTIPAEKSADSSEDPPTDPEKEKLYLTYGFSKDHRPDLKQFLTNLICVEKNIPIFYTQENGNESDKTINNKTLTELSGILARHGIQDDAFIYVADSAMVTKENLALQKGKLFITRLPNMYGASARVIQAAIEKNDWQDIGKISEQPDTKNRKAALYRFQENTISLYGEDYRVVVVHSSAHHSRTEKRLEKNIETDLQKYRKLIQSETADYYACHADAELAIKEIKLLKSDFHFVDVTIIEKPIYARGPKPENAERKIVNHRYKLAVTIAKNESAIAQVKKQNGCFVLLTSIPAEGEKGKNGEAILRCYKEQYGVERNFSFLKDPIIVNDLFLKTPERIEALGLVMIISLMVANLIERDLRMFAKENDLEGWNKSNTEKPTWYMLTWMFCSVMILKLGNQRVLNQKLSPSQLNYLKAMNLSETIFTMPISP